MRKWKQLAEKYRALPYAVIALALTACNGAQALLRTPASVPYAVTLYEGSLLVQGVGSFSADAATQVDPTSYLSKGGDFAIHGASSQTNGGKFTIKRESVESVCLQGQSTRAARRETCTINSDDPSCVAEYGILSFKIQISDTEISGSSSTYHDQLQWRLLRRTSADGSESIQGVIDAPGATILEHRTNTVNLTVSAQGSISGQVRYKGTTVAIHAMLPQAGTPDALEEDPARARGTSSALLILSALHMLN